MKFVAALFVTLGAVFLLSSCASLSKEECLTSDWQVIGQRDGAQGEDPQRQFQRHITACEKVKVTPNHTLWNQGYQQGLINYCTPVRGLSVGQEGRTYLRVCPASSERGFLNGYVLGKKEHSVKASINSLENRRVQLNTEIDDLVDKAAKAKAGEAGSIKNDINTKRFELESTRNEKEREIYRLSRIEQLVAQFLQNPNMVYDQNQL